MLGAVFIRSAFSAESKEKVSVERYHGLKNVDEDF